MARKAFAETQSQPALRVYLRRSKADEGHQQFSLDVQREGSRLFVADSLPRFGLTASWADRIEYVDDDRAGDDFLGRRELRRLRDEVRAGDVVLCRDQSRLGRDALEVTLAVREIVQERGGRLFYYADGQEVPYAKAIDAAMTFVRGVGHQMELEAIRSRVREALRSRVRAGRIAGGRCFGYSLRREQTRQDVRTPLPSSIPSRRRSCAESSALCRRNRTEEDRCSLNNEDPFAPRRSSEAADRGALARSAK